MRYYSLQYGETDLDIKDFNSLAEYVAGLDLIISVDTAVLHLAGAMGKKTYGLVPYYGDARWRKWQKDSYISDLYPSVRIFRQLKPGDWDSVFEQLRDYIS